MMTTSREGCLVCATRGGEASRMVQMEAIHLAKEMGMPLVFLYIIDEDVLKKVDPPMKTAVYDELMWMGKTLLRIAQKRAGVENLDAQLIVRTGDVKEEIGRFLKESNAGLLLLGAPRGTTANVFGDDAIEQFAQAIERNTNINVRIIRPEDQLQFPLEPAAQ